MEGTGGGLLGRLAEKTLGWIILAGLILLGVAVYKLGPAGRQAIWEGVWRTAAWLIVAAALPWSARLFVRRIIAFGSNWAGLALLAAYVVIDVIVGALLLGGLPTGGWGWVASLAALGVAGTYNFLVAEYLTQQAGG